MLKTSNVSSVINHIRKLNTSSPFSDEDIDKIICELNLIKNDNIIIGNNGTGKTNFLKLFNNIITDENQNRFKLTTIHCSCGHTFDTDFPMESDPPCASCMKCKKLHYDK